MSILSVILLAPLVGVFLVIVIPRDDARTIRQIGVAFAVAVLILSIVTWGNVARAGADETGTLSYPGEDHAWIAAPSFNVRYTLGADGLSAPLVFLTALTTALALVYSTRTIDTRVKEFFILFLLLETCLCGTFLALDLVLFYVFWVVGLVPMLLLIGVWGGEGRERAALKFFLYNLLGSVAMLLSILAVYSQAGTFDVFGAAAVRPFSGAESPWTARVAFLAFFVAFAIRLPSFPFHTWLPQAQSEAPTAAGAVLSGAFLGTAGYGLIRIGLPLFPAPFAYLVSESWVLPVLAAASILYGALVCLAQWDLRRLVACLSVVQLGFVTLGVSAAAVSYGADAEAAAAGLSGAAMQVFAHGAIGAALFFLTGVLYRRTQTHDLRALGGLARRVPQIYGLVLLAGLAAFGLPGLAGFWGQFFVFKGAVGGAVAPTAYVGALGLLFAAGCVVWKVVQHAFLGELDEEKWGQMEDLVGWERVTVWPLVLLVIILGVYPSLLLEVLDASLGMLLAALP